VGCLIIHGLALKTAIRKFYSEAYRECTPSPPTALLATPLDTCCIRPKGLTDRDVGLAASEIGNFHSLHELNDPPGSIKRSPHFEFPCTMPFSSQFSLSLELTNLIPIPRRITDRVSAGVSELLTAIVRSGSDPETERLTMEVFGRNTIETRMERTFREVTQFSTKRTILQESLDIVLDAGAGPTLQRALESPQYLATVIQLSMLSWGLGGHRSDLAEALAESMRRRLEGAPRDFQIYPEKNGLKRFIKACEEQSSTFPWQRFFDAVQGKLGLQSPEIGPACHECYRLNVRVLQSCLDMFTAVQLSPEQYMLRIQCRVGVVTLVVWAHCVLGLAVGVFESPNGTVYFGDPDAVPRVFIHIGDQNSKAEVCLLDSALEIVLVQDVDSDDAQTIFGEWKHPARGYGTSVLRNELANHTAVKDMVHVIAVLALWICQRLDERQESPCKERDNIISAMNFVFDGVNLDDNQIQKYFPHYGGKKIDSSLPAPRSIKVDFESMGTIIWWSNLITRARSLALLVLALSCVHQLEQCQEWRLGSLMYIERSPINDTVGENWDGIAKLPFCHDTWYEMLLGMMRFDVTVSYCDRSFLFSKDGWSIYMSSFGDFDPFDMPPGLLIVKPGVPTSRNDGERRHQLVDDPVWAFRRFGGKWKFSWECKEKAGESTWPRCEWSDSLALRSYTGKGNNPDAFVVAVGYGNSRLYSGYQEMHEKRCEAHLLQTCAHNPNRAIVLPEGTATGIAIFGNGIDKNVPRICISLVRGSVGGRWLTVLSSEEGRRIALTMGHVCLECAIEQTLKLGGNWFIVC